MIILLPPSEGKAAGGSGHWEPSSGRFGSALVEQRKLVCDGLKDVDANALKVRGKLAERALRSNAMLIGAPALPAAARYNGVVYKHLDFPSLEGLARRRALSNIVVVSGLGGLFSFSDPVPEYRASVTTRVGELGVLSSFWVEHLPRVFDLLQGPVVDLLPAQYRKCVSLFGERVVIDLVDPDGVAGSHNAKAQKGRLARELLIRGESVLDGWSSDGWTASVTSARSHTG